MSEPIESDIEQLLHDGAAAIAAAASTDALAQVETELFGKRSALSGAHRSLGSLEPEQRKEAGRRLHEVRAALEAQLATRRTALADAERAELLVADRLDLTEVISDQVRSPVSPGPPPPGVPDQGRARRCVRRNGLRGG